MQASTPPSHDAMPETLVPPQVGRLRLLIGRVQGIVLYLLYRAFTGDLAADLTVWPATARLPQTFPGKAWNTDGPIGMLPACLRQAGAKCDVFLLDLAGDARPEVVVIVVVIDASGGPDAAVMAEDSQRRWSVIGKLPAGVAGCGAVRDAIAAGRVRAAEPAGKALEIDGHRLGVRYPADSPLYRCPR